MGWCAQFGLDISMRYRAAQEEQYFDDESDKYEE